MLSAPLDAALAMILGCFSVAAHAAETGWNDPPFDRPLQVRQIKTGKSATTPGAWNELRCFTYAHFMIKEIDHQELGDEQISILPLADGAKPPCQTANLPGERVFSRDGIADYFLGVKGAFVFLSAADGVDRGLGFAIYRAADSGLVFSDSAAFDDKKPLFRAIEAEQDGLRLRYTRVHRGACSVATEGAACWAKIAANLGLPVTPVPDCAAGYLRSRHDLAAGYCEAQNRKDAACVTAEMARRTDDDQSPSVMGYEIEAVLLGKEHTVHPTGTGAQCWPAD